jgi:hypothetical protein
MKWDSLKHERWAVDTTCGRHDVHLAGEFAARSRHQVVLGRREGEALHDIRSTGVWIRTDAIL